MKKGIKTLIIVAVIFVVAIVAFFVNGISIYTQSCVFSTKYYAEPQRAFEKEYTPSAVTEPIEIKNDIYLYDIDENNAIYFAMTKSGDLLASDMHKKNGKYFSLGNYALYDLNDLTETFSTGAKEQKLYGNNGKFTTTCKWKLTIDENSEENNERIKIYNYKIEGVEYHLYLIILK